MHGRKIGAYRVVRQIGGTTDDREARHVFLAIAQGPAGFERAVVLKCQPVAAADDPSFADRVVREATVYARLTHPAIVQLFDLFEAEGNIVMVREYVHGVALSELLVALRRARMRLPDPASFFLIARIFDALAAAHAARHPVSGEFTPVIHRDVTPANVLVPWDGYAKLSDFGMAKLLGRTHDSAVGIIKGSFGYLAPEQVLGDPITVRTDLYGAALVARELLTGCETFPREGMPELEYLQRMAEPRLLPLDIARPDLPAPVLDVFRAALEPDSDRRAVSAMTIVDVLRSVSDLERGRRVLVDVLTRLREQSRRVTYEQPPPRVQRIEPAEDPTPPHGVKSSRPFAAAVEHAGRGAIARHPTPGPTVSSVPPASVPALARRETIRSLRSRRRALTRGALVLVAALSTALGYFVARSLPQPALEMAAMVAAAKPVPAASSAPPKPAPPTPKPVPTAIAPLDKGYLRTPIKAKHHRIFVDGRFACVGGESVLLPCGPHEVKVGSAGKKQQVFVPCGGEIAVAPKW